MLVIKIILVLAIFLVAIASAFGPLEAKWSTPLAGIALGILFLLVARDRERNRKLYTILGVLCLAVAAAAAVFALLE